MNKNFRCLLSMLAVLSILAAPAFAQTAAKPAKDKAIREAGPIDCDRAYPDKAICPPKTAPEERRCEVLAKDLAGQSGLTGYVNEQKKTDMRKQYDLMCAKSQGSASECQDITSDLSGSAGNTAGFAGETRRQDLRWLYERRCGTGVPAKPTRVIVVPGNVTQ